MNEEINYLTPEHDFEEIRSRNLTNIYMPSESWKTYFEVYEAPWYYTETILRSIRSTMVLY